MQIEIWSDVVCPWCYLGERNLELALEQWEHRTDVEIVHRSFELDPTAAAEPRPTVDVLAEKYGMSTEQVRESQLQMEERAAEVGLEFHMDALRSGNTRDAHRLLHLGRRRGVEADLAQRLHRAYFTEQRDIFDHAVLATIAAEAGVPRDEAESVLSSRDYQAEVEIEEETAHDLGATGVPFMVVDRRFAVPGAQPADVLVKVLDRAAAAAG